MQSTTHLPVRCSVHPPQNKFYKKGGRLSAYFHSYLCGREAAEWLISVKVSTDPVKIEKGRTRTPLQLLDFARSKPI